MRGGTGITGRKRTAGKAGMGAKVSELCELQHSAHIFEIIAV